MEVKFPILFPWIDFVLPVVQEWLVCVADPAPTTTAPYWLPSGLMRKHIKNRKQKCIL
jgi:hypothetical protein